MTNSAIKATYLPTYRHFIVYEGEIIMGKRFGQQPAFFACLCGGRDFFCIAEALSGLFFCRGPFFPAKLGNGPRQKNKPDSAEAMQKNVEPTT